MTSRRAFLTAAPAVASYGGAEIEKKIARRDFHGLTKQDLPTPALLLDSEIFERNLAHMAAHCRKTGIHLRAHVKVHRSADIGKRQVAAGAVGLCCATIAECEWMHRNGISGLLWTAQPAGPNKISRVVTLSKADPTFQCVVDDEAAVAALEDAAAHARTRIRVLVDIDVGIGRQGVHTAAGALALAQRIDKSRNVQLGGLMGYSGAASHAHGWEKRKQVSAEVLAKLAEAVELCRKSGIPAPVVSGGSTGTYNVDNELGVLTELQAGSYALMDAIYSTIGSKSGSPTFDDFGCALTVLTRVISKKYPNKAAIDAGGKTMTRDTDVVRDWPGVKVRPAGAEYGMLVWEQADREPKLGDTAELVITNLDLSVNVFDRMFVCQGDRVVDVFSVLGRSGAAQR